MGIVQVDALDASASSAASVRTTAPPTPGTYYYSACVEPVSRESNMTNNCSEAVAVAVLPPPLDLVVDAPRVSDSSPMAGQFFALSSTVRNRGPGISGYTTLSYYRSSDSTVTLADTEVGANRVSGLIASGSSAESVLTHAPPTSGTYYYGVCVGGVSGESDTTNNCSDAVAVTVSQFHIDNLPWVADGITGDERRAMGQIRFLARIDPPMSQRVAGSLWLADGISEGDLLGISQLLDLARSRPQAAALVTTIPDQTGELMQDAMNSLQHLNRSSNTARLDQALSQSWFQDGLTQEEAALIVVLISAADTDDVFQDLLEDGHVKSETISLPLAGDVDLFAVGRSEYGLQKTLDGTSFAVEALEGFMVNRIPKSNVIVLVETRHDLGLSATGGWNTGTHVVTKTKWSDTLYHEIAHFCFGANVGALTPKWLTEGAAIFLEHYTLSATGGEISYFDPYLRAKRGIHQACPHLGAANVQGWIATGLNVVVKEGELDGCSYVVGLHFLAGMHHILGHEAVRSALRDVYESGRAANPTEDTIYQTFLRNIPEAQLDDFRFTYHCLHGRPIPGYASHPRPHHRVKSETH